MKKVSIAVLIVGGGPVGLAASLFLGRHGIHTFLVEKRDGTSTLPRAPGLQARTMELFRAAGCRQQIRNLEQGDSHPYFEGGILRVNTFSEIDQAEVVEAPSLDGPDISPERVMGCGQDRYERVLLELSRQSGCEIQFGTELISLEQDDEGVTAVVRNRTTDELTEIRANYVIGADGASSTTRRLLDVQRQGIGTVFNALSIYFRAPRLQTLLQDRKFILCYATAAPGTMMGLSRLHGCDPWLAAPQYYPEKGEKPEDFTDERCVEIIRTAAGVDDLDVEIVEKVPWQGAQLVADTFRVGSVFLAGDAAHLHPPAGGFGANTGIHDAHNLAWKLAAVLNEHCGVELLDTYDAERRQVGEAMADQAMVRNRVRHGYADDETRARMVDDIIVTLGYKYHSNAIVDEAPEAPVLSPDLTLNGQPGTRAPHIWLRRGSEQISTIDLFWDEYVLLTGSRTNGWVDAARNVAKETGIPVRPYVIDEDGDLVATGRDWASAYGVDADGVVLVRPDAIVAWRSRSGAADTEDRLRQALRAVAGVCE